MNFAQLSTSANTVQTTPDLARLFQFLLLFSFPFLSLVTREKFHLSLHLSFPLPRVASLKVEASKTGEGS